MITVRVGHTLKSFYLGIDMLNNYTVLRKPFVKRLLLFCQLMILA